MAPTIYDTRTVLRTFASIADERHVRWHPEHEGRSALGSRIALLDSGINEGRSDFAGASIVARDFTRSRTTHDFTGHGTGNAALLVGQGAEMIRGLTPRATLLVAKVLARQSRKLSIESICRGIRWAVSEHAQCLVLPFGTPRESREIHRELRHALKCGIAVFCAAGNRGRDVVMFPARMPGVVCVSAAKRDGSRYPLCGGTSAVDQFAPGANLPTLGLEALAWVSGSSPAAAIAAGLHALATSTTKDNEHE